MIAKGLLRHAFHGSYSCAIVLAFDSPEAAAEGLGMLARFGFGAVQADPRALVARLDSEGLQRFKNAHAGRFAFLACGRKGCPSGRCKATAIDALTHSIDIGPPFSLDLDPAFVPPAPRKRRTRRAPPEQVTIRAVADYAINASADAPARLCRFCNARPVPPRRRTCGESRCMSAHLAASRGSTLIAFAVRAADGRAIGHVTAPRDADDPRALALRDFRVSRASGWYRPGDTLDNDPDPAFGSFDPEVQS